MTDKVKRTIIETENKEAVIFTNPSYDNSIIGLDTDQRVVYSFDKMIKELVKEEGMTETEAIEFIEYNTIRTLPYIDEKVRPIIIYMSETMENFTYD